MIELRRISWLVMVVFSVITITEFCLAGCVPWRGTEYEITAPVGRGMNFNCATTGFGTQVTALTFGGDTAWVIAGVTNAGEGPSVGIELWVRKRSSIILDWRSLKVISESGKLLEKATYIVGVRGWDNIGGKRLQNVGKHLSAKGQLTSYHVVMKVLAPLPESFWLVFPRMQLGTRTYDPFKAYFQKTVDWFFAPVNC